MKIYTIKDHPNHRIVERDGKFYPEHFFKFFIFKGWTSMYYTPGGNIAVANTLDFAVDFLRKKIEEEGPTDKTPVEEISL